MRNSKTKQLVTTALLAALIIVLQTVATGIHFGPFTPTLSLIPIIIGAIVCGPLSGAFLGLVFGVVVIIGVLSGSEPMSTMMLQMHPVVTVSLCLIKGMAAGLFSGLVYKALCKKNETLATAAAAFVAPVTNTGIFCIALVIFFMPICEQFAAALGFANGGAFIIGGVVGTNFLFELALNTILIPVVIRILGSIKK